MSSKVQITFETKGAVRGEKFVEHGSHWVVMQDPEGNEFCVQ